MTTRSSMFHYSVPLLLATLLAPFACAHLQPTTLIALDVESDHVAMNLHIPLPELELAFGRGVTRDPEAGIAVWGPALRAYLTGHIHPVSADGRAWSVQVQNMTVARAEQTQSGPFQEVTVNLDLAPPAGASLRTFTLNYEVILHQVVTHKVLVSVRSDWSGGRVEPAQIGMIAVNTTTAQIEPFSIDLGAGSWWTGFKRMIVLGAEHIREGTDHLLFLLVLLLPSTLTIQGRRWSGFGGTHDSLLRLLKIVSAFTLGHSATLLAGALHWLRLPQQPVEVLIAFSILVTAIHALRPIFPGQEAKVASGFGLVHGLAFANVLADLKLSGGPLALSILGFNLGIEFMQLLVIAFTVPWLILLSQTPAHRWIRIAGAVSAGIAASGWMVNRVTGKPNLIERLMDTVTEFAPLGILILAVIAIAAYLFTAFEAPSIRLTPKENS